MPNLIRAAAVIGLIVLVAACSGAAATTVPSDPPGTGGSGSPGTSPTASAADVGAIEHGSGATDIVLRYDQGGGFVAPSFTMSQAPIFTLYGDGTIVFRNPALESPAPAGSVIRQNPLRTAKLSEDQVQDLLAYALGPGNLGVARAHYDFDGVADASTGTFTIDAGGIHKTVAIYALGMEVMQGVPDQAARAAFAQLAERLADFDQGGTIATDVYAPATYRGVLMDGTGMAVPDVVAWPWKDIKPDDFASPADPNAVQAATRVLTTDEVASLGVTGPEGGLQGMVISGPGDGKLYSFALRPLLPDETE
jgi:hypothetical protein